MRPHLEKTHYIKWACEVAEDVGLEFQLQYHKKKKKKTIKYPQEQNT
jgi:hypothetical protein